MTRRLLITVILTVTLLLAAIILYRYSFERLRSYDESVEHTQEVIYTFSELNGLLKSIKIYSRNYPTSNDRVLLDGYIVAKAGVHERLRYLTQLVSDSKTQERRVDTLTGVMGKFLKITDEQIRKTDVAVLDSLNEVTVAMLIHRMEPIVQRAINTEQKLLKERKRETNLWANQLNLWIAVFIGAALLLLILSIASNYEQFRKRQTAEDFLQSILNTTQNGVITYSPISFNGDIDDFRVTYANRGIIHQLKRDPEDLIGKTYFELWPNAPRNGSFDRFVNVYRSGVHQEFETKSIEEGSDEWFHASVVRMQDGVTVTFNNITNIKQFEAQLQQKIQELVRTNSELEQFAYVSSHDLQEPLRKIEMFSALTEQRFGDSLPEEVSSYLNKILLSSQRMRKLINDLLNYSSVSRSREPYATTNLANVVNDLVDDFELTIAEKDASVKIISLPTVEAVPLQMNQLFQNLLSNSLKFTIPGRKPVITANAEFATPHEVKVNEHLHASLRYYKITWKDNGIGFDPQFVDKIFTIFQRLHTRDEYEGTGIGLALCKKIVLNHNGDMQAHSVEDGGAMFCIYLPVKQPEATKQEV